MKKKSRFDPRSIWKRHIFDNIVVNPVSKCWIMQSPREPNGFVKTTAVSIGRIWAHRLAFLAWKGDIPKGKFVLHSLACTSRACVNPDHLSLGDPVSLAEKREKAGNTARGERHGRSKLSAEQVQRIREISETTPDEAIALAFDISPDHVRAVRSGRYWKEN